MKLLNTLSNKILSLFVKEAGACVPTHGDCCRRGSRKYVSCTGPCVRSSVCP